MENPGRTLGTDGAAASATTPSLYTHYRCLNTTTSRSAPVPSVRDVASRLVQVPTFHAEACTELMPPIHRLPSRP